MLCTKTSHKKNEFGILFWQLRASRDKQSKKRNSTEEKMQQCIKILEMDAHLSTQNTNNSTNNDDDDEKKWL